MMAKFGMDLKNGISEVILLESIKEGLWGFFQKEE